MSAGLAYVALSRATCISKVGIADGLSRERLTSKIAGSKNLIPRVREEIKMYEGAIRTIDIHAKNLGLTDLQISEYRSKLDSGL